MGGALFHRVYTHTCGLMPWKKTVADALPIAVNNYCTIRELGTGFIKI